MTIATTPESVSVLYDNSSEPKFPELQRRRRFRIAASAVVIGFGIAVVAFFFVLSEFAMGDPLRLLLFLSAFAFFGLLLVGGLMLERRSLHFRVTAIGIEAARYGLIPEGQVHGAQVKETGDFIYVWERGEESRKPLLALWKRELASPAKFKAALEELIRMADTKHGESTN